MVAFLVLFPLGLAVCLLQDKPLKAARLVCLSFILLTAPTGWSVDKEIPQRDRGGEFATDTADQFPLSYIYGSVVEKDLIRDDKGKYATNIRFQPRYASELFTQNVLFCGNRAEAFNQMAGPVVVTYRRVAHKLVKDVPCFDLLSVDRVESQQQEAVTVR